MLTIRKEEPPMQHEVLQIDITGLPQAWISVEAAASHLATDSVVWTVGEAPLAVLRGGTNSLTGLQSVLEVPAIIALRGASRINLFDRVPAFSKGKLLRRDRHTCAYCMASFDKRELTVDHIDPESRGGRLTWMNTIAACRSCNSLKANRTPEEARMPLCFMPYVPSRHEDFLLKGRKIRVDVHEWLAAKLPRGSRLA
jgi:5-methylcytosine-specific restriction endonuclease McrA